MGRQFFSLVLAWAFTCVLAIGTCQAVFEDPPIVGLMIGTVVSIGHVACPLVPSMINDGLEKILGPE